MIDLLVANLDTVVVVFAVSNGRTRVECEVDRMSLRLRHKHFQFIEVFLDNQL